MTACINCDDSDGQFETEELGPFCEECWGLLTDLQLAAARAAVETMLNVKSPKCIAPEQLDELSVWEQESWFSGWHAGVRAFEEELRTLLVPESLAEIVAGGEGEKAVGVIGCDFYSADWSNCER